MDATVTSTPRARFWVRRNPMPLLLLTLMALIWGLVRGPDIYWQWRAERTVDSALKDVAGLKARVLADLASTGKCPTATPAADPSAGSSTISRVAVGEYFAGYCSIQLNLKAKGDSRLRNAQLMLVYKDGDWLCLPRLGSAAASPMDICRDDVRQIFPGVRPAA